MVSLGLLMNHMPSDNFLEYVKQGLKGVEVTLVENI